jgi:hypothetical protein
MKGISDLLASFWSAMQDELSVRAREPRASKLWNLLANYVVDTATLSADEIVCIEDCTFHARMH